jgi:cysteinyl-tRNA synthetase
VDDKIIKRANEEGVTAAEISERYIKECLKDLEGLNVKPATKNPKATEEIDGMIEMISTLIEKGMPMRKTVPFISEPEVLKNTVSYPKRILTNWKPEAVLR